jgi:tetratricopeptide (TPR) repeat protein
VARVRLSDCEARARGGPARLAGLTQPGQPGRPAATRRRAAALLLGWVLLWVPQASPAAAPAGCADDIEVLESAILTEPSDADAHAALGRCYLALGRTAEAPGAFQAAVVAERGAERRLELAGALFHAGRYDEAESLLSQLAEKLDHRATLHLYQGLLALERGDPRAAAEFLDHARRLDPAAVEPLASYYAGIAWNEIGERERAEEAFARIEHDWPDTVWAREAKRSLDRLQQPISFVSWLDTELGTQWDSNLQLTNSTLTRIGGLPATFVPDSPLESWRGVWFTRGGVELSTRSWRAGVQLAYSGSEHTDEATPAFESDDFDVHYPEITLYGKRDINDETSVRAHYRLAHAWIGGEDLFTVHTLEAAVSHRWAWGESELFASWQFLDYDISIEGFGNTAPGAAPGTACTPGVDMTAALDRDGIGARFGFQHTLPAPPLLDSLQLHYAFGFFDSDGSEYAFHGHEFGLEGDAALPYSFNLLARSTYYSRELKNASVFDDEVAILSALVPEPGTSSRVDRSLESLLQLERKFGARTTLGARYRYRRRFSEVRFFDYSRHVIGFYVRVRLAQN